MMKVGDECDYKVQKMHLKSDSVIIKFPPTEICVTWTRGHNFCYSNYKILEGHIHALIYLLNC